MLDMTATIVPKSDQLNADDLMSGPVTVTIESVRYGSDEQPIEVITAEFGAGRPYKPAKSMRRVMVVAWGKDGSTYAGKRLTLYRDPEVRFGRDEVGGIRISHMSHIDKPIKVALTVSKGKRAPYTVEKLPDVAPPVDHLRALGVAMTQGLGLADRESKLAYLSESLGRTITASNEVTQEEAQTLLGQIAAVGERRAEEAPAE